MPIANYSENEQQKRNQQQAGGFRSIGRMPLVLVAGIVFSPQVDHKFIVRRGTVCRDSRPFDKLRTAALGCLP
jgi:hypothetical protein